MPGVSFRFSLGAWIDRCESGLHRGGVRFCAHGGVAFLRHAGFAASGQVEFRTQRVSGRRTARYGRWGRRIYPHGSKFVWWPPDLVTTPRVITSFLPPFYHPLVTASRLPPSYHSLVTIPLTTNFLPPSYRPSYCKLSSPRVLPPLVTASFPLPSYHYPKVTPSLPSLHHLPYFP